MTEAQLPRRVRVIEPHVTNDPNPIRFQSQVRFLILHCQYSRARSRLD